MSRNSRKKKENKQTIINEYHITKNYYIEKNNQEMKDINNPTTFCKNMMPLILFLCISINIFLLLAPFFIKQGITKEHIYKDLFFCIGLDIGMIIDYFIAFRLLYYDYIYQIQTKEKNIIVLLQSIGTVVLSTGFSQFKDSLLKLDTIIGFLYYFIFLCMSSPIWLFFIEVFFLLKDANNYRAISEDETKHNLKEYINKTILIDNKRIINIIILDIVLIIIQYYLFFV